VGFVPASQTSLGFVCPWVNAITNVGNSHPYTCTSGLDAHNPATTVQMDCVSWVNMFQHQAKPNALPNGKGPRGLKEHTTGAEVACHRCPSRQLYEQRHPKALRPPPL